MIDKRVVITGMGAVTPAGVGVQELWDKVLANNSMIKKTSSFPTLSFSTNLNAEVSNFDVKKYIESRKLRKLLSNGEQYCMASARMAIENSAIILEDIISEQAGLFLGCTKEFCSFDRIELALQESFDENGELSSKLFGKNADELIHPLIILESIPNACIEYISELYQLKGDNTQFMTTGVSSSQAIGTAFQSISNGKSLYALTGGFDSFNDILNYSAFDSIELMTKQTEEFVGPFDKNRDGFVLGEGGGMLFLEEREHALARGAHIYAEIVGYATTMEADNLLSLERSGTSLAKCINEALDSANISTTDINYVNAYASGTTIGDLSEANALKQVFKSQIDKVPVSTLKGTIGHLIGASGVVELISTIQSIERNIIPPIGSLTNPDPECGLNFALDPIEKELKYAISISRGMGGQNSVIVLKKHV